MSLTLDREALKALLADTVDQAVDVQAKMKHIQKTLLDPLEQQFEALKQKLQREMTTGNMQEISGSKGRAKFMDKDGRDILDVDALLQANNIPVTEKDKFTQKAKRIQYIQVFPKKKK